MLFTLSCLKNPFHLTKSLVFTRWLRSCLHFTSGSAKEIRRNDLPPYHINEHALMYHCLILIYSCLWLQRRFVSNVLISLLNVWCVVVYPCWITLCVWQWFVVFACFTVLLHNALPFVGFGFLDNCIMIVAVSVCFMRHALLALYSLSLWR